MINSPENGQNPETEVKEADPAHYAQTATAVAEPDARTTQSADVPSEQDAESGPEMSAETLTPVTASASTATTEGAQPAAIEEPLPATSEPVSEAEFSSELGKFQQSFEAIQAEFIGEPRAAVEKAETLIDGLMKALHDQLQRIHSEVKTETDTEHLRVAMLGYRELFDSFRGHRTA